MSLSCFRGSASDKAHAVCSRRDGSGMGTVPSDLLLSITPCRFLDYPAACHKKCQVDDGFE
jgi:hypothetical protein